MAPGEVHHLVAVVVAARDPRNCDLGAAVEDGSVPPRRAARLLRALAQIDPFVTAGERDAYQAIVLPLARTGSDKDLAHACTHLEGVVRPEPEIEHLAAAQRRGRDFVERSGVAGMTEFVWRLDPEGAAVVHAVTLSLLAKPCPGDGDPDPRTPGHRRADALLIVLKRGMATGDGVHTNGAALMVVRLDHGVLEGQVRSLGRTATGELLSPGTLRRIACEADLIPAVYGGPSALLELGRSVRLATRAQHVALGLRDRGCTMPGCSMPAQFCITHHATWWSRGGTTDVSNLALLCERHHTDVHDHDIRATIDPEGVTWHV